MVIAVILAALSPRCLRIGYASLTKRGRLAIALSLDLLEPFRQLFNLLNQGINHCLLLLNDPSRLLATRAIGRGLGNIHDPRIVAESLQFHHQQFPVR